MQAINTSFYPAFRSSVSTCSRNFAPSWAEVHGPSTSLRPSRSIPMATYTALHLPFVAHLRHQRVQKQDRVQRLQRPHLPGPHVLQHRLRHLRNQRRRYLHSVHFLQMYLDFARGHPARIQPQYLVVQPVEAPLVRRHNLRLKLPLRSRGTATRLTRNPP